MGQWLSFYQRFALSFIMFCCVVSMKVRGGN